MKDHILTAPFLAARALLLMKGGKSAEINQKLRAGSQNSRRAPLFI